MRFPKLFPHAMGVLSITLTACGGSNGATAKVTLLTGLESSPASVNLMEKFSQPLVAAGYCVQNQIYAAIGPSDNNGPSSLSTFPVRMVTPVGSIIDTAGGATWLSASTVDKIVLDAPTNVPLDFGIVGSVVVAPAAKADGICPLIDPASASVNPSYSVIGHTNGTIKGNTTIPIRLWSTVAESVAASLPAAPTAGSVCANSNGNSNAKTQQCGNLNFKEIALGCASGTNCLAQLAVGGALQLEYFQGSNGNQHITQLVPLSLASAASSMGILIPDVSPITMTILSNNGRQSQVTYNDNNNGNNNSGVNQGTTTAANPSPTPAFTYVATGVKDGSFPIVVDGSGVTPPGNFFLNANQDPVSGNVVLAWGSSDSASAYDVNEIFTGAAANNLGSNVSTQSLIIPMTTGLAGSSHSYSVTAKTGIPGTRSATSGTASNTAGITPLATPIPGSPLVNASNTISQPGVIVVNPSSPAFSYFSSGAVMHIFYQKTNSAGFPSQYSDGGYINNTSTPLSINIMGNSTNAYTGTYFLMVEITNRNGGDVYSSSPTSVIVNY